MLTPLRSVWILAFGLALLCPAAGAVPSRDDLRGKREDRDASSIQLQRPEQVRERSYDALQSVVVALSLALRKGDELPPGVRDDFDKRAREWRGPRRGPVGTHVSLQDPADSSMPIPRSRRRSCSSAGAS